MLLVAGAVGSGECWCWCCWWWWMLLLVLLLVLLVVVNVVAVAVVADKCSPREMSLYLIVPWRFYFLLEIILTIMCFYFLILIDLFCRLTILGGLTRGCIDVLQVKGLSGNRTTRVALTMAPFLSRICSGVWNSVGKMGVGGQGGLVQKRYLEQLIVIKKCRWMEATALPTVSQPLPIIFDPSNLNSWCFMIYK